MPSFIEIPPRCTEIKRHANLDVNGRRTDSGQPETITLSGCCCWRRHKNNKHTKTKQSVYASKW